MYNCCVCKKEIKDKQKYATCSFLCTYAVSHYCYLLPGGNIELTKPMEHITQKYKDVINNRRIYPASHYK